MIHQINKKILYASLFVIVILIIVHFTYYLFQIPSTSNQNTTLIKTDGIVVLTGDKYRISEGIKILKKNSNERLLI